MSYNFNIDIVNKKYLNEMDIHKETTNKMLKIKKGIKKLNENIKDLNLNKDKIFNERILNLENSCKDSQILLDILQKKIQSNIFEKYNVKENKKIINNVSNINNEINQNILMKKKFLNNTNHISSKIN